MSSYDDLLSQVDPKWRTSFRAFVENAEADDQFLEYLSQNPACERAAEEAIKREAGELGPLSTLLEKSVRREPEAVSRSMATIIRTVIDLNADQKEQVITEAARELKQELGAEAKPLVAEVVGSLENQLTR